MTDYSLLRSQKNEVLELIKQSTLDPYNFSWSVERSRKTVERSRKTNESGVPVTISILKYNNTPYYFIFEILKGSHFSIYSPGGDKLHESQYPGNWKIELEYVRKWLTYIQREVEQPDLWEDLLKQKIAYDETISPDTGNEPFSTFQAGQIIEGIENIRKYLLNEFKGDQSAEGLINQKLDYLIGASKRQGRNDWFHTSIGVFVGIATALAMSPDQTKQVWFMLKNAISGIIKLLPF